MATFEGIQHIGEKVFSFLPRNEHLKCRLVCKSWKINLEKSPMVWLKKLEILGQPNKITKKWLQLVEKCRPFSIFESKIVNLMIQKYINYMKPLEERSGTYHGFQNLVSYEIPIEFPPIYQALYCKPENLDVLKCIMENDKRSYILPIQCPNSYLWITPLIEAINMNANTEVIKCLVSKISNPFQELNGTTVLHVAIRKNNVEACKILVEKDPKKVFTLDEILEHFNTPFKLAFSGDNFDIIKCLALSAPVEQVDGYLWRALNDYRYSKAPEKSKEHLLKKINFVGSLWKHSESDLKWCGRLNFPLTDSDIHEFLKLEYEETIKWAKENGTLNP